jgi:hypothetical protein
VLLARLDWHWRAAIPNRSLTVWLDHCLRVCVPREHVRETLLLVATANSFDSRVRTRHLHLSVGVDITLSMPKLVPPLSRPFGSQSVCFVGGRQRWKGEELVLGNTNAPSPKRTLIKLRPTGATGILTRTLVGVPCGSTRGGENRNAGTRPAL